MSDTTTTSAIQSPLDTTEENSTPTSNNQADLAAYLAGRLELDLDDSNQLALYDRHYYQLRPALLSLHPWSFARKMKVLTGVATTQGSFQHDLPDDFLRLLALSPRGSYKNYQGFISPTPQVNCHYLADVEEENWSALFRHGFALALEASLTLPLSEDFSRAQNLQQQADQVLQSAWRQDRSEMPAPAFQDFPLYAYR